MDAHVRLLSTREALESHEAIAECDSNFLSFFKSWVHYANVSIFKIVSLIMMNNVG